MATMPWLSRVAALDARIVTGASVSKALGAPGLRTGWLAVADADLRARLTVAGDEYRDPRVRCSTRPLAAVLLRHREGVLAPRRRLLAGALGELAHWCESERERVRGSDPTPVRCAACACASRHSTRLSSRASGTCCRVIDLQLASGAWFGESSRVFRWALAICRLRASHRVVRALGGSGRRNWLTRRQPWTCEVPLGK